MNKHDKILILGSAGMVGSAILRNLHDKGHENIVGTDYRSVGQQFEKVGIAK